MQKAKEISFCQFLQRLDVKIETKFTFNITISDSDQIYFTSHSGNTSSETSCRLLNRSDSLLVANGLPYTLAAQIAYPERQCVAFVGDGGFSMLMADFATAVKYRLPIKIVVLTNGTLGQIKWEQMVFRATPSMEWTCNL